MMLTNDIICHVDAMSMSDKMSKAYLICYQQDPVCESLLLWVGGLPIRSDFQWIQGLARADFALKPVGEFRVRCSRSRVQLNSRGRFFLFFNDQRPSKNHRQSGEAITGPQPVSRKKKNSSFSGVFTVNFSS